MKVKTRDWTTKVKRLMTDMKVSQVDLAKQAGVSPSQIGHYLKARSQPPLDKLELIALALKTDLKDLLSDEPTTEKGSQYFRSVPVVDWDLNQMNLNGKQHREYVAFPISKCSTSSYALIVKGDSMTSNSGGKNSFNDGDRIIADPTKKPVPNDYVIAKVDNHTKAIFRQYVVDGPFELLKPINTQYQTLKMDDSCHVMAVIVGSILYRN